MLTRHKNIGPQSSFISDVPPCFSVFSTFNFSLVHSSIMLAITSTASLTPLISESITSATSSAASSSSSGKLLLASLALPVYSGSSSVVPLATTGGSAASSSSHTANVSQSGRIISGKIQVWSVKIPVSIWPCSTVATLASAACVAC